MTAALLLLTLSPAGAQTSTAPAAGYVVRVDSAGVYLDLGHASGASAGQGFVIYAEGDELRHPVTGASLGRTETPLARGTLREIRPLYSLGTLSTGSSEIREGLRARLEPKAAAPPPAPAAPGGTPTRSPRWRSPALDLAVTGMAVADFKGDGSLQAALSDGKRVLLYPYPPSEDKPLARYSHPGTAPRLLSLEAADLNGNGRSEIFATLYNGTFERFETLVLELEAGSLRQVAEIPGVVRGHQDPEGKRALAVQQLVADSTFPFGAISPLAFKDGKYGPGRGSIRHKRVEWIYDFTTASLDGTKAVLFLTANERLRVQFEKRHWRTREAYGQTPARVRWHGRLLHFHPPMPVAYPGGAASIYLVKNVSALGSLSEPFGLFGSAELHRKDWGGLSLESSWKSELSGYCPALALVGPENPGELAVAVVGTSGKSSLWIYDP